MVDGIECGIGGVIWEEDGERCRFWIVCGCVEFVKELGFNFGGSKIIREAEIKDLGGI